MGPDAHGRSDFPWNGEYFATEIARQAGRDESPTALVSLHHDNSQSQAGQGPVPKRKVPGSRRRSSRKLGDDGSLSRDLRCEPAVLPWIDHVDAAPEHG
jgi:hypothetical protein